MLLEASKSENVLGWQHNKGSDRRDGYCSGSAEAFASWYEEKNIPTLHVWLAHIARYCVLTSAACAYIGKPNCPELCTAEIA